MIPLAVAMLGAAVVCAGLRDQRVLAAVLTFSVVTNASSVLENEHGAQGFLLPLAVLTLALAGWRRFVRTGRESSPWPTLALIGIGLVAATFLSAALGPFVADRPAMSAFYVSELIKHLVVAAGIVVVLTDRSRIRAALLGLAIGAASLATITVAQMALGAQRNVFGGFGRWTTQNVAGLGESARAAGPFFDDPNSYAQHLAVGFGAALGLVMTARRGSAMRQGAVVCAGLIVPAMLATSSRTGLLAIGAIVATASLLQRPTRAQTIVLCAVVSLAILGPFGVGDRLATLGQVQSVGAETADASLTGRASEALAALRMFAEHPVTGVGFGAYPSEYLGVARQIGLESRLEERSAHSLPLEIAAEQGLLGVAAWAALATFAVVVARRSMRRMPDVGTPIVLALVGFAATAIFLHDVHPRIMWMLVAIVVGSARVLERRPAAAIAPVQSTGRPVVAMVIQNYVPSLGGAERQLANLVPRFVDAGIRPVVITRGCTGRPHRDEVDGVPVLRLEGFGPKPIRSLLFVMSARHELARIRPDVIHAFDTLTPSTIAMAHRRKFGTPVITKLLRSGDLGDLAVLARKPFGAHRVRTLVRDVDLFVAISSDLVQELSAHGVPEERIVHIPNGVDTDRFVPLATADRRQALDPERRVIATGRLAPEKRLIEIARRWGEVTKECNSARLVLVGDGPDRHQLEAMDGTVILGARDDIPDLLRWATVYASSSDAEGLSNSLLEAMACGLPCVVTDVGGVRDVVRDGENGVIVPAGDFDGLVTEVARLLGDDARRRHLGVEARRRVCSDFSLDRTARALVDEYSRLANVSAQLGRPAIATDADERFADATDRRPAGNLGPLQHSDDGSRLSLPPEREPVGAQ